MLTVLALLTCVGAGIIGGVFYAFSTFVMQALAQLPPHQGMAAMQRINVVVLNPWFLGVFMATALLALACAIAAFLPWTPYRSPWLLAGGLLYLGTFLITGLRNVPLNERLAHLDAAVPEATGAWVVYVRTWTFWNHARTAAAIASAACCAVALAA